VRVLRNIAIIAAIALAVDLLPGGGNAASAVVAVLLIAFLATLGFAGRQLYRENRITVDTLSDRDRGILYGAIGLIVLMIAAASELLATAGGTLVWVALLSLAVGGIVTVWTRASSY
jgi:hypothetical protein